jgi:hypothetical protein
MRTIVSFILIIQHDEVPKKQRLKKNHGQANAPRLTAAQSSDKDGLEADRLARGRIKGRRLTGRIAAPGVRWDTELTVYLEESLTSRFLVQDGSKVIYVVVLLNAMVSLSISTTVAQAM